MANGYSLRDLVRRALDVAKTELSSLGEEATLEVRDERVTDIATRGDRAVSGALIDFFKEEGIPAVLVSEESGRLSLGSSPELLIAIDDIDGTDNFYRGRNILPYCTVLTVFRGTDPVFENALAAGIVEHRSGTMWSAEMGQGALVSSPSRRAAPARASTRAALDRRSLVVVDQYSAKERAGEISRLSETAWLKDFGSSALHLAGVASGLFDGFVNLRQKTHELGAGFVLIRESGGSLLDLDGRPLDTCRFEFDEVRGIVAAGTKELALAIIERLQQG